MTEAKGGLVPCLSQVTKNIYPQIQMFKDISNLICMYKRRD